MAIDGFYIRKSEQTKRRLVQRGALLAQGQDLVGPVTFLGEPGEVPGKGRVFPAACQPGTVVHQPQAAQWLNQGQFGRIEIVEFVVAFNQLG